MKAVAYQKSLPVTDPNALIDVELPTPTVGARDVLVRIKAVSVNPVDTKIRRNVPPAPGQNKVLGFDAAGIVEAVGEGVTLFKVGDEVFYSGTNTRAGTNSELHVVDERLVGRKPQNVSFADAAALPLTALTAWELLFDRLQVSTDVTKTGAILITGAAGGVGSILTQLARVLTGLTVVATAGRPESEEWLYEMGAHHVINHHEDLVPQLHAAGVENVNYVASLTHTHVYFEQYVEALAPQGKLALIDDPEPIDVRLLKRKCLSLHWEFMFTRSAHETDDMIRQHEILNAVARLVEDGALVPTGTKHYGTINAANLLKAHAFLESGQARGKIVLEGF